MDVIETIRRIDFGDIDGMYDKNLHEYFIDKDYWSQLIEGRKFFVIGRKGTGKSAIYNWIKTKETEGQIIVSNLSFKNFPFEKLLTLTDDNFSRPNQYQSVWRNIILSEIAKQIIDDQRNQYNDIYKEISEYVNLIFGKDLTDLHAKITSQTFKNDVGLFIRGTGFGFSDSEGRQIVNDLTNITQVNYRLETLIQNYVKISPSSKYIVQFDQLDDNYTIYLENNAYFQSIISLFKVIYDLNQKFYQIDAPVKIIGYLRSDIFNEINNYDAESSRWDDNKLYLSWSIINREDWGYPALLELLDRRITTSIPELVIYHSPFRKIFESVKIGKGEKNVFTHIINRSFQRPRDIIQFCKKIREKVVESKKLTERTILDAEKSYSIWLLSEVANEFGPYIKDKNKLYEFFRTIGAHPISYVDFCKQYMPYEEKVGKKADDLLELLYRLGIILNKGKKGKYYSVIRNERSLFDRNLNIVIAPGLLNGLHIY